MSLTAVLVATEPGLVGRAAVEAGRAAARRALELSARAAGAPQLSFGLNEEGVPRDEHGWCFSTTNTAGLSAAVVASCEVGIDAESLARPRPEVALGSASAAELALLSRESRGESPDVAELARAALILWTAREAVLKLARVGLAGLSRVRICAASRADRLQAELDGARFEIALFIDGRHALALATREPRRVRWIAS